MAVKFFGQFLMEIGVISRDDLLKAVQLQESTNLKFGEIAMTMGFLTEAQIEKIHDAQRSEDLRFGDMALKLGLINVKQMQQILTRQKNGHLYIGEALIRVGALREADLPRYLDAFKADQAPYVVDGVAIPPAMPHIPLLEIFVDLTFKLLCRIADLPLRQGRCLESNDWPSGDVVAAMDFSGPVNGRYILAVSTKVQKALAKAILKEDNVDNEPQEVLQDTVMEFINIACGNIVAKATQLGLALEIHPPEILTIAPGKTTPKATRNLRFPMFLPDGDTLTLQVQIAP